MPELKQVLGAMIFGANRPLTAKEMRKCLAEVAELHDETAAFMKVRENDVVNTLESLAEDLARLGLGFHLSEIAGGYRFQTDPACGRWLKRLLDINTATRLSRPALETLAIIAYRQPVSRTEIEGVRGVNVDHIMKLLMELQMVRITGRSELPGKPFLYGTTQTFLEHFGLKSLDDLNNMDPVLAMDRLNRQAAKSREPKSDVPATPASQTTQIEMDVDTPAAGADAGKGTP